MGAAAPKTGIAPFANLDTATFPGSLQGGLTRTSSVSYTEDGQKHSSSSNVNKTLNFSAC